MGTAGRHQALAAIAALLLAAAPAPAVAPCHCPSQESEAVSPAAPASVGGCHAAAPASDAARDTDTDAAPSDSSPCKGSCDSCATVAGLTPAGPTQIPTLVESQLAVPVAARRAGESRPPDHVPLPL